MPIADELPLHLEKKDRLLNYPKSDKPLEQPERLEKTVKLDSTAFGIVENASHVTLKTLQGKELEAMIIVDDKVSNGCQVDFEESKEQSEEEDGLYYRN